MSRCTLVLVGLSLLLNQLDAQILGARPLAPTAGAKAPVVEVKAAAASAAAAFPVTPAAVSRRDAVWDSAPLPKLVLTFARGAAIEVNMDRLGEWRRTELPEFGAVWINPLAPTIRLGINYVTGGAARNLMAGAAWGSVPSALRRDAKDGVRLLVNDDSAANPSMVRPLGLRTRVYGWESVPAVPDAPALRQLVVASGDDTHAYIFTLEGPAQQVKALEERFAGVVSSFDPLK